MATNELDCAVRRCCEESTPPYGSLPASIRECSGLSSLGLEGHVSDWGFSGVDCLGDNEPIEGELTVISLGEFLSLLEMSEESEPMPEIESVSLGDCFTIVSPDTGETCPFRRDCAADCAGLHIPYDDECLLLGRHPHFVPIPGDEVALQVSWIPGGPFFDLIDLKDPEPKVSKVA